MTGFFASILNAIYGVIGNYGVSIIVFTLLVRIVLLPLAISQRKNMLHMQKLQPQMKELQKKYKNDRETLARKQQELYKENNYNPFMGCLPMLIQLPIIFSLFGLFRNAKDYLPPSALTQTFLWLPDMETPDVLSNVLSVAGDITTKLPGLLPIIAAIFTFLTFKSTMSAQQNTDGPNMNFMGYIGPIMILWFGANYAAGLILYWAISNIIQYVQNLVLVRVYDGSTQ